MGRLTNGAYKAFYGLLWWLIGGYELDLRSQLIIQVEGSLRADLYENRKWLLL